LLDGTAMIMVRMVRNGRSMLRRVLTILVLLILVFYALALYSVDDPSKYYSYNMFLGPLSKNINILILYTLEVLAVILLLIVLELESSRSAHICFYIAFVLAVFLAKYFLPQYFDSAYFENFYDAGGHMIRGKYVTLTGHSDVGVDAYFDIQPAFFWWTAAFINIVYGAPSSPQDSVFLFLTKWFNAIALMLYLPILVAFFRVAGLSLRESLIAYGIFLLISLSRFHYAAQVYSYALYWIIMILILRAFRAGRLRSADVLIFIPVAFSIVFVHQGITLFTLVSVSAVLLGAFIPLVGLRVEISANMRIFLFLLAISLASSWLIYLSYLTIYTFGNFVEALRSVVMAIVERGIPHIVAGATARPYEPWMRIVSVKALYMALIVSISLFVLLIISLSRREFGVHRIYAKIFLYISSALTAVVGIIALALGGAGYIERIPEALAPILSLTFLRLFSTPTQHLTSRILSAATAALLILLGSILYFAGWNFQSIPYSEAATENFAIKYGPNLAGIYSKLCIEPLYYPVFPYEFGPNCLYVEYWHNDIQAIYYLVGDPESIAKASNDITKIFSSIFKSPTASIYLGSS